MGNSELFSIFHFNDVYDLQPQNKQPKAGAAYFKSLLDREKDQYKHKLTLFSGDAFSPSLLSNEFEGQNMIKPLNSLGIDVACVGNHQLAYSVEHVKKLISQTNFPWLLSNVYDKTTGGRLVDGLQYQIKVVNDIKIGIFSLAEKQWVDTLYPCYKQICEYVDYIQFANYMVQELRETHKCDMVIALTHMMRYNDIKLAENVPEIDLILGGHDHLIIQQKVNNSVIIKSGTNFRNFSTIEVRKNEDQQDIAQKKNDRHTKLSNKRWIFDIKLKQVHHQNQNIKPDPELNQYISDIYLKFQQKQQKTAFYTLKPIDLTFKTIRKQPVPFLQFLVSFYQHFTSSQCAFMNSGNFRMDCLLDKGPVSFGSVSKVISDPVVVKKVPGKIIIKGIQTCLSMYPNLAGRYSVFAGLQFQWDSSKRPYQRVNKYSVKVNNEKLDEERIYKVAMHSYTGLGGDGFQCFIQCPLDEQSPEIDNLHIIQQLINLNEDMMRLYQQKYNTGYKIIEVNGEKFLQLDLQESKRVKMVNAEQNDQSTQ